MCKAFSCLCGRDKTVVWEFGKDSHEDLLKKTDWKDDTIDPEKIEFARIEISPKNGNYLDPDRWQFKIDMDVKPVWWTLAHKKACLKEHEKWLAQLNTILIRKPIIHPFRDRTPPEITPEIIDLVRQWASVWASVRISVWASVEASVGDSVEDSVEDSVWDSVEDSVEASVWASVRISVRDSVWDSVWDSVEASVEASVWAYIGSFFLLPRSAWRYTENINCGERYPFQPAVDLWEMGLVASFDGKKWRLHGGPEGKVL